MSSARSVALVGVGLAGVALIVSSLPVFRRPRLAERLHSYLGALAPRRSRLLEPGVPALSGMAAVLRPMLHDLGARLNRLLGDDGRDLARRLESAGEPLTPSAFRAQQVTWGFIGFGGAIGVAVLAATAGRDLTPAAAVAAAVAFGATGVMARDRALTRAAVRRRERMTAELPTLVDLVCLAVTAGESLRGALELVAGATSGPLAGEVRRVLRDARAGRALPDGLEAAAERVRVGAFDRFVTTVLAAHERGMPLADSLRAMAFDVREARKRTVIEAAGRKQVSMLAPVVGLMLPVAIAFAFFPGLVAIRTLAH